MSLYWIIIIAAVILAAGWRLVRYLKYRHWMSQPFPSEWSQILSANLPPYKQLADPVRNALHKRIMQFIYQKNFEGCGGQEITDEIKVTIAAQACLLIVNRKGRCYPKLTSILVYPSTYRPSGKGLFYKENPNSARLGESWTAAGVVVLAWDSVKGGAENFDDGKNVTLHEFAHQLDQLDGNADGVPILSGSSAYAAWSQVFSRNYQKLRKNARSSRRTVLDKYGATNPAEYFAVATEAFFEKPEQLKEMYPEMYQLLVDYYQFDPESIS